MRNTTLSVQDRAHQLVNSHKDWILTELRRAEYVAEWPKNIDAIIETVHYAYLESCTSPILEVELLTDELDVDIYTHEFAEAVYVAIEKLCL